MLAALHFNKVDTAGALFVGDKLVSPIPHHLCKRFAANAWHNRDLGEWFVKSANSVYVAVVVLPKSFENLEVWIIFCYKHSVIKYSN